MSQIVLPNCVIDGDIILMPYQLDSNLRYNLLKEADRKYRNRLMKINGTSVIINNVRNIKSKSISSKLVRESNASAVRFYFRMVVDILNIVENDIINCTITGMNNEFIEATILSSNHVIVFIVIDESAIIDSLEASRNFDLIDDKLFSKRNKRFLQVGDAIKIKCEDIVESMHDLVAVCKILDMID